LDDKHVPGKPEFVFAFAAKLPDLKIPTRIVSSLEQTGPKAGTGN